MRERGFARANFAAALFATDARESSSAVFSPRNPMLRLTPSLPRTVTFRLTTFPVSGAAGWSDEGVGVGAGAEVQPTKKIAMIESRGEKRVMKMLGRNFAGMPLNWSRDPPTSSDRLRRVAWDCNGLCAMGARKKDCVVYHHFVSQNPRV